MPTAACGLAGPAHGLGGSSWSATYADATLDVVDRPQALREKIPLRIYETLTASADQPPLEDLDIRDSR